MGLAELAEQNPDDEYLEPVRSNHGSMFFGSYPIDFSNAVVGRQRISMYRIDDNTLTIFYEKETNFIIVLKQKLNGSKPQDHATVDSTIYDILVEWLTHVDDTADRIIDHYCKNLIVGRRKWEGCLDRAQKQLTQALSSMRRFSANVERALEDLDSILTDLILSSKLKGLITRCRNSLKSVSTAVDTVEKMHLHDLQNRRSHLQFMTGWIQVGVAIIVNEQCALSYFL